jgi:hypothetical protein
VTLAVARHATRWLLEQSLAEIQVQQVAIGESAVRVGGDGPRRGQVVGFEGSNVVLLVRDAEVRVPAANYTLTANFAFIRRHHSAQVLRRLQVASGSLTATGQRNRFAVKHRFAALAADLDAFGSVIELPGGGWATLEPEWLSVEVQSEA